MDMNELADLTIKTWELNLKLSTPGFTFNENEKHFMKMAFEAGYKMAKAEDNKKNNP